MEEGKKDWRQRDLFPVCFSLDRQTLATVERIAAASERNRSQTARLLIQEGAKVYDAHRQEDQQR